MKKILLFLLFALACFLAGEIFATGTIEINTAPLQRLDEIAGIGPVMAQRIIDSRPFSSIDDLLKVKGIGPKILQKIKDQGLAYVGQNSKSEILNSEQTPISKLEIQNTTISTAAIAYSGGVFINEILPAPEGPDETNEWIELYNSNSFEVSLAGWQIEDTVGTPAVYVFSAGAKITANGFLVLKRPETKIILNNTEDGLNLFWPDKKVADSMSYENALLKNSYNKTESGWVWSLTPTPGSLNITIAKKQPEKTELLPKSQKSDNNIVKAGLLDINQYAANQEIIKNNNPWFLFFIAAVITMISAAIVLFIKLKFKKVN